jgi:hypothetical protein
MALGRRKRAQKRDFDPEFPKLLVGYQEAIQGLKPRHPSKIQFVDARCGNHA